MFRWEPSLWTSLLVCGLVWTLVRRFRLFNVFTRDLSLHFCGLFKDLESRVQVIRLTICGIGVLLRLLLLLVRSLPFNLGIGGLVRQSVGSYTLNSCEGDLVRAIRFFASKRITYQQGALGRLHSLFGNVTMQDLGGRLHLFEQDGIRLNATIACHLCNYRGFVRLFLFFQRQRDLTRFDPK